MPTIFIRFYEELNDFLPAQRGKSRFAHPVPPDSSIKNIIEQLGVPHTEVDLILANGRSVDFSYQPGERDDISVYPMFESMDISPVTRLRPRPLRRTRFVLDNHLGRLARYLRMLGLDSHYQPDLTDTQIIRMMEKERRMILTRDRKLLCRRDVTHGCFLHENRPKLQVVEVVRRFDLSRAIRPFSRCLDCNTPVVKIEKAKIPDRLPAQILEDFQTFRLCPTCERIFWQGSHAQSMTRFINEIQTQVEKPG